MSKGTYISVERFWIETCHPVNWFNVAMSATRSEIIEDLRILSCERLCLSCWSGCITEYITERLDRYDIVFFCIPPPKAPHKPLKSVTAPIPSMASGWETEYVQPSGNMRNDAKTLNTISRDCLCDLKSARAMLELEKEDAKAPKGDGQSRN